MLISENTRRSNARVLYGILAQSALSQFDSPQDEPRQGVYFRNLITLLELYQFQMLGRPSHRAVLDRHDVTKQEVSIEKQEAKKVEAAITAAHAAVFRELSRDQLVEHFRTLFARISGHQTVDNDEIVAAKSFLKVLRDSLRG